MNKIQTACRQNIVKMKYIKVYIKAGRHSHKKLKKQVKSVDRMNIKIYSESSLYIREEYKYLLLQFLNKKKHIFSFFFFCAYCDLVILHFRKLSLLQFATLNSRMSFLIYLLKFLNILMSLWPLFMDGVQLSQG